MVTNIATAGEIPLRQFPAPGSNCNLERKVTA